MKFYGGLLTSRGVTVCLQRGRDGLVCTAPARMFLHPLFGWMIGCESCNTYLPQLRGWPELIGRVAAATHEAENWARARSDVA